jgi:RND family efflux transporter MFP subunit
LSGTKTFQHLGFAARLLLKRILLEAWLHDEPSHALTKVTWRSTTTMNSKDAPRTPGTRRRSVLLGVMVIGVGAAVAAAVIHAKLDGDRKSGHDAGAAAPPAAVAPVTRADLWNAFVLAAEFRPFQEVNVYARTAGYVRQMKVDVGDRVKAGDVLAVLEIPELEDDVRRALAGVERAKQEVERARANYRDAHLTYGRLAEVIRLQPNLVAGQEVDQAQARDDAAKASLDAVQSAVREAEANHEKLSTMASYARITAPFPGVVTRRYADTGSLVGAGTNSSSQALVHLSQLDPLRLVLPVPESAVPKVHPGAPVDVMVQSTRETLKASVTRVSGQVSTDTRTMPVEVDVPNAALTLAPGMYASASLVLDRREQVLSIPIEAAPDRKGRSASVYVVDGRHRIEKREVTVGLETATRIEVIAGLREGELVLLGGRGQFQVGQAVDPRTVPDPRSAP